MLKTQELRPFSAISAPSAVKYLSGVLMNSRLPHIRTISKLGFKLPALNSEVPLIYTSGFLRLV